MPVKHIVITAAVELLLFFLLANLIIGTRSRPWRLVRALPRVGRWRAATAIGLIAGGLSLGLFLIRIPAPAVHDEFSYLLAADTFASFQVTNPPHPLWEHFETFYILQQPTYASMYPPGQGLLLALGQILGGQPGFGVPLGIALAAVSVFWMLCGWLPQRWAMLGGLMSACHSQLIVHWGHNYWGGEVAVIGGALLFGAWPRVMRTGGVYNSVLLSCGAALLAISRPFEGFIVCLPVAASLLVWLATRCRPAQAAAVILPTATTLSLAGVALGAYNQAITGSPFRLPAQVWGSQYSTRPLFLWQAKRSLPTPRHAVLQRFADRTGPWELQQDPRKLLVIKAWEFLTLWAFFLQVVLTLPLLALPWVLRRHRMAWVILTVALLAVASANVAWLQAHYWAPIFPLLMLLVVQGCRHWNASGLFARRYLYSLLLTFFLINLGSIALHAAEQLTEPQDWSWQRQRIQNYLEQLPGRHLVVVRYAAEHSPLLEWVYNRADIDAAKVVWARDMGDERNQLLLTYFQGYRWWQLRPDDPRPILEPYARLTAAESTSLLP